MALLVASSPKTVAASASLVIVASDSLSVTDLDQPNLTFGDGSSTISVEDIAIEDGTSVFFDAPSLDSLTSTQIDERVLVYPGGTIKVGDGLSNTVVEGMLYKLAVS